MTTPTTTPTDTPVPSKRPQDFVFNAELQDILLNSAQETVDDRRGQERLTWSGIMARTALENPVAYASGLVIQRITQQVLQGGVVYRALPGAVPFTTSGTWGGDDEARFTTSQGVRQDQLALPGAAAGIGATSGGTGWWAKIQEFIDFIRPTLPIYPEFFFLVSGDYGKLNAAKNFVASSPHTRKLCLWPRTYNIGSNEWVVDTNSIVIEAFGAQIVGSGKYVVTFAAIGGDSQPSVNNPVSQNVRGLSVRTVSPFGGSDRFAVRVSSSYSYFELAIACNTDAGGSGLLLEADDTGTGPYYNTFVNTAVQGKQDGTTTGFGILLDQRPGTTATRYPNTNKFFGGRVGGFGTNVAIAGGGNQFYGLASENAPSYGTAFRWLAPVASSNVQNAVFGCYIENAATAFVVDANASGPQVFAPKATGVTTMVSDPSNRLSIYGNDGIRDLRLASAPISSGANASGIFVGNANNADPNTLDWYQEGTWTAVISGGGTPGTYELSTNECTYTRLGRQVTLQARLILAGTITGGGTSYLRITGLPFAKSSGSSPQGVLTSQGVDFTAGAICIAVSFETTSSSSALLFNETIDNGSIVNTQISALSANDQIYFTLTYEV